MPRDVSPERNGRYLLEALPLFVKIWLTDFSQHFGIDLRCMLLTCRFVMKSGILLAFGLANISIASNEKALGLTSI
jgi:hypothetical protein